MSVFVFVRRNVVGIFFALLLALFAIAVADRGGIHLAVYFLFGLAVFPCMIFWIFQKKRISFVPFVFLLFFLIWMWLSYAFSPIRGEGIRELLGFSAGGLLFFFLSEGVFERGASQVKISLGQIRFFLKGIVFIAFAELVYAYFVYVFEPFNRIAGSFRDFQFAYSFFPNAFANFLLMILPILVYFFWTSKKKWSEIGSFVLIVFFLAALFLTFSRGAFMVFFFIVFLLGMFFCRRIFDRAFLLKIFKFFVAGLLSLFIVSQVNALREYRFSVNRFQDKITLESQEKGASVSERIDFWKGSLFLIMERPFFGFGPYAFQFVYPKYQRELLALSDHPHNIFLKIAVENGIPALAFFSLFLLSVVFFFFRSWKKWDLQHRAIVLALGVSVFAGILHNLIDYNFNFLANFFLFWIFLGLLVAMMPSREPLKNTSSSVVHERSRNGIFRRIFSLEAQFLKDSGIRVFMIIITVVFTFFTLHELYFGYFYKKGRVAFAEKQYDAALLWYKKADPLFLKRRLYFDTASTYLEQYKMTGEQGFLDSVLSELGQAAWQNPYDAFMQHFYAKALYESGAISKQEALEYFRFVLELDSLNNLEYFLSFLQVLEQESNEFKDALQYVVELLDVYAMKVRNNEHLTVLTDNPRFALSLYDFLIDHSSDEKREMYFQKRTSLYQDWMKKALEMYREYGVVIDFAL